MTFLKRLIAKGGMTNERLLRILPTEQLKWIAEAPHEPGDGSDMLRANLKAEMQRRGV